MSRSVRLTLLGLIGAAISIGGESISVRAGFAENWMLDFAVGGSFIAGGLVAMGRRPDSRFGPLMFATGCAWFIGNFGGTGHPLLVTVASAFESASVPMIAHVAFAYPHGRLQSRQERWLFIFGYGVLAVRAVRGLLFFHPSFQFPGAPEGLAPFADPQLADALGRITDAGYFAFSIGAVALLTWRFVRATPFQRRTLFELWLAGMALAFTVAVLGGRYALGLEFSVRVYEATNIARILIPVALVVGLFRLQLRRAAVGGLVVRIGSGSADEPLRDALASTLGDPSLRIAYWLADREGYVDENGRAVEIPADRSTTVVERAGGRLAVLIHDPALAAQPELVEAATAAVGLALENARLHAEIRAQLEDVRASRARIVEAADTERVRIERNLHDGAQQRLLAVSFALRAAQRESAGDERAQRSLQAAAQELGGALEELRELARGVYPAILTEEGLGPAVESLVERSPIPTSLDLDLPGRLPPPVENTAYFVLSESLTNAVRYSGASRVDVRVRADQAELRLKVADDGIGGADPAHGSGLRGIDDRVAAVGGELEVFSRPGQGTTVRARLPCASS